MKRPAPGTRLARLKERLLTSYLTIPAIAVTLSAVLALVLVKVDGLITREQRAIGFSGSATSARELLSTIASSMLTLTGLVFSITIVVLQLTSSQFSPRVLRTFLRDRQSQLTLGVFVATFTYALLALREVRGENGVAEQFIPGITISTAFGLVVVSLITFVAYIHHITQSIRVINIIEHIASEAESLLERRFERDREEAGVETEPSGKPDGTVTSGRKGVVVDVDVRSLVEEARRCEATLVLLPRVGEFVPLGGALFAIYGGTGESREDRLRRGVTLERERTMQLDLAFGFRQLVDVAERSLSPGINDPTTAVQCLDQIHNLLRRLVVLPIPTGRHCDDEGRLRLCMRTHSFDDYLHLGLDEIRHWGAGSLQVQRRIRRLLEDLLPLARDEERRRAILEQRELLEARLADLPTAERELVKGRPHLE